MGKIPPEKVYQGVFADNFSEESDVEQRMAIEKAIADQINALSSETTSAEPGPQPGPEPGPQPGPQPGLQPGPQPSSTVTPDPCNRSSDQEIRPSDQENHESTSPTNETAESPTIITNINERYPRNNDVRNRLNFASVVVRNTAAFTFKTL